MIKKWLFIFLSLICLSSCILSDWDVRLILLNSTNEKIRVWYEIKNKSDYMPDTAYCKTEELYWILPQSREILRTNNRWNFSLKDKPDKMLRIFIVNEDSLSKYGTCEIFKQQIFIKRFDFTYDDLEKINWRVVYDGK